MRWLRRGAGGSEPRDRSAETAASAAQAHAEISEFWSPSSSSGSSSRRPVTEAAAQASGRAAGVMVAGCGPDGVRRRGARRGLELKWSRGGVLGLQSLSGWNGVLLCLVVALWAGTGPRVQGQEFSETAFGAIGTTPQRCEEDTMWCSRCENTTELWLSGTADPTWVTFSQVFNQTNRQIFPTDGQPITEVDGATFPGNQYHYFEFIVRGGDGLSAEDVRRDSVFFSLLSPERLQVSRGQVVATSADAAKRPAYDFYVGQNCIPKEGSWNNQGYGNINANEKLKSIHVNITRDGRYFIALQSRKLRYNVAAFDFTMKLSRGSLQSRFEATMCTPLTYRYPDEIQRMIDEYKNTKIIGQALGGPVPVCGATPPEKKYNIRYVYPAPPGGLSQREIAIVVGAVGSGIVTIAIIAGVYLWVRYKRTTQRMAKFSSLSRGLPDALLDGEGQEVAV